MADFTGFARPGRICADAETFSLLIQAIFKSFCCP